MGELIAVLSGKGGTGKTSLCAGIAEALALQGEKVLCIDCDVGLRNLDIALGISQIGALSFQDVCSGQYGLESATRHPVYPTISFLTAPLNCPVENVDLVAFSQMLEVARSRFSYVLLDAPAGIDAGFRLAAQFADRLILVAGADPASLRDASRAADVLEEMGKTNARMIINRVNPKMMTAMGVTVDDMMDQSGLPLLGVVPEDENVIMAAVSRQPLLGYTKKGATAACRRIAKRIQGHSVPVKL
ncbi:MAG: AAA family ATPase [Oscillospiraceae bacterium]|nr:AAA family ATPase [Oscillospiraceae bacterium]